MRDAEEVAREVDHATKDWDPGNGASEEDLARWADLIRARDAEVAEQVRAETLAGFEAETRTREDGYAGWTGDRFGGLNSGRMIFRHATRERRLVGPWEPEP